MSALKVLMNRAENTSTTVRFRQNPDSEIEIDVLDDGVYLCDYSPSHEGAEQIKKICESDEISIDDIEDVCDKNDWSYVA